MNITAATVNNELLTKHYGLTAKYTLDRPYYDPKNDWNAVQFTVTFLRGNREFSTSYKYGVGHFPVIKNMRYPPTPGNMDHWIARKGHVTYIEGCKHYPSEYAFELAKYALHRKLWLPDMLCVLHSCCRDAITGHDMSFEEFCSDLGYDSDSITAKNIYDECSGMWHKLRVILSDEKIVEISNLDF
jgi:hypothetical protein